MNNKFKKYCLVTATLLFFFVPNNFVLALDNNDGPGPDTDRICEAANVLCQESCDLAKYTSDQRADCGSKCKASYDQCQRSAAMKGKSRNSVGDMGTGGVLKEETSPVQTGRKKPKKKQ